MSYHFILFFAATFAQTANALNEDEQIATQEPPSAMFTLWNLIADLIEMNDQKESEQQQIKDFYAKSGATFPRIACLMQIYFNAMKILHNIRDFIFFSEGDNNDLVINENFVRCASDLIKKDYHVYDKSYLPCNENESMPVEPMVLVEKDTIIAAWKWYEHHLNVAAKLFTIDPDFTSKTARTTTPPSSQRKNLKQMIMLFDFNIFSVSSISDRHPVTGQTYV